MARAQNPPVFPAVLTAPSANKEYKGQIQTQLHEVPSLVLQEFMTSSRAPIDDEQASYQRALNFLTANEPERRLDVWVSCRTFQALEKLAHVLYATQKYDSSGSGLTIYTAPSALHGASAAALQQELIRHRKQELFRYIQPVGVSTYNSLDEQCGGSKKTPDGGLKCYKNGRTTLALIIEVGVSEGYRQLKAAYHALNEKPRFRFPSRENHLYGATQRDMFTNSMEEIGRDTPLGPYCFDGHNWFGKLHTVFIEVYQRDLLTDTILPCNKYPIVQQGRIKQIGDVRSEHVQLEVGYLLNVLSSSGQNTAMSRFREFVRMNRNGTFDILSISHKTSRSDATLHARWQEDEPQRTICMCK
ncbi:hypothetical protein V1504DRAFT_441711 [Lipomyces starkeyi]